jgi:transglutaminase/protease-like cytokinesis protein 3
VTYGTSDYNNEILEEQLHCYYFNILKEELNKTHYPSEQKWLHIMGQIPLKEFCEKPMFSKSFFLNEGQLISQKKGEIVIKKGDEIELKLESFNPKIKVLYSYNIDNVYKKPSINMNEKITELLLKSPETDSFLKIYFNNKLALQYKVKVQ